jgi:hypothetical protein
MRLRYHLLASAALAALLFSTAAAAQPRTTDPAGQPGSRAALERQPQTVVIAETDARATREAFKDLLEKYPPNLGRILKMDPALLRSPEYLQQYPALSSFLAVHPEIPHNPNYYLEFVHLSWDEWRASTPQDPRVQAVNSFRDMLEAIGVFFIFLTVAGLLAWLVRTFLDYRRWLRVSKVQTDVHNKILERLGGTGELLTYVQSTAGRKFLESAPIPLDPGGRSFAAPFARILWSVQAGVVLLAGGLGFQFASGQVLEEIAQGLWMFGVLAMAFGIGFIASGFVSYILARRLGLLDPMPPPITADRIDPSIG